MLELRPAGAAHLLRPLVLPLQQLELAMTLGLEELTQLLGGPRQQDGDEDAACAAESAFSAVPEVREQAEDSLRLLSPTTRHVTATTGTEPVLFPTTTTTTAYVRPSHITLYTSARPSPSLSVPTAKWPTSTSRSSGDSTPTVLARVKTHRAHPCDHK